MNTANSISNKPRTIEERDKEYQAATSTKSVDDDKWYHHRSEEQASEKGDTISTFISTQTQAPAKWEAQVIGDTIFKYLQHYNNQLPLQLQLCNNPKIKLDIKKEGK